jgi:hypothetical protein
MSKEDSETALAEIYKFCDRYDAAPAQRSKMIAQHILREDLGMFGDLDAQKYAFEEGTLDRLLANTRKDAAHALLNSTILLQVSAARHRQMRALAIIGLLLLASIAWRVWHIAV